MTRRAISSLGGWALEVKRGVPAEAGAPPAALIGLSAQPQELALQTRAAAHTTSLIAQAHVQP
jgi:hypothetical protein